MKLNQIKPLHEADKPIIYHGKTVDPKDLTAEFHWNNKVVPIGKFDPESYAETGTTAPLLSWDELKPEVIAQLDLSKILSSDDLVSIDQLDKSHFVDCIVEK